MEVENHLAKIQEIMIVPVKFQDQDPMNTKMLDSNMVVNNSLAMDLDQESK